MVSKHLGVLKLAGLVRDRRQGRETHYHQFVKKDSLFRRMFFGRRAPPTRVES